MHLAEGVLPLAQALAWSVVAAPVVVGAYVEIKSIGALKPPAMTEAFCDLIEQHTGIAGDRIYVAFEDVNASQWGWNGNTFG